MMYLLFGWVHGQQKGGMGDYLGTYKDRATAMEMFDYAQSTNDHVLLVEIVGYAWKRVAGFNRGMPPEGTGLA